MKEYELVNFCEFDTFATKSYCAVHSIDEDKNLGDITQVNEITIDDFDLITWGSPCQDFSTAGEGKGSVWKCKECGYEYNPLEVHYSKRDKCPHCNTTELDKSRSSLLVEGLRIIRGKRPNFSIYENVKNIVGKRFKPTFDLFKAELEEYGYNNYYQILDGQNYGIPQHRERVFIVSIRKDIDNGEFKFPKPFNEIYGMVKLLDDSVDEKYNILQRKKDQLFKNVNYEIDMTKSVIGTCHPTNDMSRCMREKVYNSNFPSPTLTATMYKDPTKIIRKRENGEYEIRTVTELEAWRLMGFDDEDYHKAKAVGISKMQLYKQAGNSIIVDVPYYIMLELYKVMPYLFKDLRLSSFFSGIGAFEKALDRLYKYINNKDIKL